MTQTSSTMERDARVIHARGHGAVNPGEIAIGVIIGRTSEFFDFFVYAIASVLVFPKLVFPYLDPLTGTLYSFAILSLAFISRPIGTFIFTGIDRRKGKGAKLTLALFLLGVVTVAIAFLPKYETAGIGSFVLLAVARFSQGIAWGGTWDGLPSLLALNAPERRKGWYAMIPQLGAPIGLIVASGLFAFFVRTLSADDFMDWGWRYPFFVSFAISMVGMFARLRMVVTPEYTKLFEARELEPTSIPETIKAQGGTIVVGAFAPLASFALLHMVTVFPLSWIFLFTREAPGRFLMIECVGAVFGLLAMVVSGYVADKIGRRTLLAGSAVAIAIFSGFAPKMLDGGTSGELTFMISGFILLGLSFGQSSGSVASSFKKRYRYTGSALTTDLAWLFGAGFAPFVALLMSSHFGLPSAGVYLLSGAVCTLLAISINRQFASRDAEAIKPKR